MYNVYILQNLIFCSLDSKKEIDHVYERKWGVNQHKP